MTESFTFRGYGAGTRELARAYWTRKRPRLTHLLQRSSGEAGGHLRLVLRRTSPGWHEAKATLSLPGRTLIAHEEGRELIEALDRTADTLVRELRRHHDRRVRRSASAAVLV